MADSGGEGAISATDSYAGFGSSFIWLIVAAFLTIRGVNNSGLSAS